MLSHVQLFAAPWTIALKAPLSMEFSRKEYWSGLPLPTPGALPDPGIKPTSLVSPALQTDSLPTEPLEKPMSKDVSLNYPIADIPATLGSHQWPSGA